MYSGRRLNVNGVAADTETQRKCDLSLNKGGGSAERVRKHSIIRLPTNVYPPSCDLVTDLWPLFPPQWGCRTLSTWNDPWTRDWTTHTTSTWSLKLGSRSESGNKDLHEIIHLIFTHIAVYAKIIKQYEASNKVKQMIQMMHILQMIKIIKYI